MKNHESPYTYCCGRRDCANLKRIVDRDEQDNILKFLMGLNDTFTATRGQILMMEPRPNISKVFNLVSQEERQHSMKSTRAVAFNISQNTPDEAYVAAYTGGYNKNRPRPICSHCGLAGHTVNRCYKLHGYPQGYKHPGSNNNMLQNQVQSSDSQKSTQNWPPRKENVANMVLQDTGGISVHNQHGAHLGTVTQEQVHQLLNVLSIQNAPLTDKFSQISGSTINLSDGTTLTSKPQPHLITQIPSDFPLSGISIDSHFVSTTMKNGLTVLTPAWVIGIRAHGESPTYDFPHKQFPTYVACTSGPYCRGISEMLGLSCFLWTVSHPHVEKAINMSHIGHICDPWTIYMCLDNHPLLN